MLFRLDRVGKEFGGAWLFREVTAQANPGDRIGLIGGNGVGKTTLLSLIEGRLAPDAGTVHRAGGLAISRVEQIPVFDPRRSLLEETLTVFADLVEMERRMRGLEARMAEGDQSGQVAHDYEALKARFEYLGGYDYPARTEGVLFGLGFSAPDLEIPCAHLSGGQRSRMSLARALLRPADLMLLDEPTNHLDLAGTLWLADFLRSQPKALVVISHDRRFLDQVTERTWEMEAGKLFEYSAPFSRARLLREERLRLQREGWERQQQWRRRTEEFIQRNIAGQKTRQAQSRRKQLERTEWIGRVEVSEPVPHFRFAPVPRGGSLVVELEDAEIGYPDRPLLRAVSLRVDRGQRLGIVGGNGTGKTTLLRCLAGELPLLGGRVKWGFQCLPAYFAQEARFNEGESTVFEVLSRLMPGWSDEAIRTFAARFGFRGEDIFKPVSGLSGGERSRLAFARLFMTPCNLLILDEPTNHLDIAAREALETGLREFEGALVVVSHDLYFLERVVNRLLVLRECRLEEVPDLDAVVAALTAAPASSNVQVRPLPSEPRTGQPPGLSKNERQRLEWRLQELEGRIGALERRRTEVEEALHTGSEDHVRLRELAMRYEILDGELKTLYAEWEQLGLKLEQ